MQRHIEEEEEEEKVGNVTGSRASETNKQKEDDKQEGDAENVNA